MEAAVTIAALPVAALALWALASRPRRRARLVALPTGERWHERATPTFGGVGIACGLAAGVALAHRGRRRRPTWELAGILAGCGIVFAAGLVDDVRHLSPIAKLAAQFAAAAIAIARGPAGRARLERRRSASSIALFWLVGITNAFNLLDNMDGLAATLATVACLYFAIDAATVHENDLVLVLALSLAFACLGFLPFNLRPGGARGVHGRRGEPAARASCSPRSASRRAGRRPGRRWRRCCCRSSCSRSRSSTRPSSPSGGSPSGGP